MSTKALIRRFCCVVLPYLFSFWAAEASALSVTFTAQDLLRLLNDYKSSGNAQKQAFAADLQKKFADVGVTFNDNGISIAGTVDPTGAQDLVSCDDLKNITYGQWLLSQGLFLGPAKGPLNGRVDGGAWSAFLDGNSTGITLSANRSN